LAERGCSLLPRVFPATKSKSRLHAAVTALYWRGEAALCTQHCTPGREETELRLVCFFVHVRRDVTSIYATLDDGT
jgi:hypothetical protein